VGLGLADGALLRGVLSEGPDWQVLETQGGGRALVVAERLAARWVASGLVEEGTFDAFRFGDRELRSFSCAPGERLCAVSEAERPESKGEALAFAGALKMTRRTDAGSSLQDALYVEKLERLLPTWSGDPGMADDVVLGCWLTGGVRVSVRSFRTLRQAMGWLGASDLREVVELAGFGIAEVMATAQKVAAPADATALEPDNLSSGDALPAAQGGEKAFELAGRPELAAFFNEHIVDIVRNRDRYKALGIEFPSAVILHGPPGCGKTFAVEQLVDFLGWPSFQIDASSIGSPYIHETSRKVAQVFEKAMEQAPSVLVIDEMEAFLADREMSIGASHHRVEEVAEFLRRIPEAVKKEVLIIAMTNRIDMIDPAIQRRGRFDHVIKVDFASAVEVRSLLEKLLSALPKEPDVDCRSLAEELAGRPLSDVSFVVREGARLAARAGRERLDQASLLAALRTSPEREREGGKGNRRIGF